MGIETALGNFLFRSKYSAWLWNFSTTSPFYLFRLLGATLISFLLVVRAGRLFLSTKLTSAPVFGFIFIGTLWGGPLKTLAAGLIVALGYLLSEQIRQPAHNVGHRAGGKGFKGPFPENTLEALRELIRRDSDQSLKDFHYVEFDVHETKDGELVVLHDLASFLAAAETSEINEAAVLELRSIRADIQSLGANDVTLQQLKAIHIGGQEGIHAPLLEEFLRCCEREGLRSSLAVEVKSISTDAGRTKFIQLLRSYKNGHCKTLERECPERQYKPFGWVAAIAFPFFWAACFGEFCTPEWRRWAKEFRAAGVPARACVLHSLDLVPPTR